MTVNEVEKVLKALSKAKKAYRLAKLKVQDFEETLMCGKGQKMDKISPNEKNGNPVQEAYCDLADEKSEVDRLLHEMLSARKKADKLIGTVSDMNQQEVLTRKYIIGKSEGEIADDMHYSRQHVGKLRRDALKEISDFYKK